MLKRGCPYLEFVQPVLTFIYDHAIYKQCQTLIRTCNQLDQFTYVICSKENNYTNINNAHHSEINSLI